MWCKFCRSTREGRSDWAGLPKHLLISMVLDAWESRRLSRESFHTLQLVCKSWREALLELGSMLTHARVCIHDPADLHLLCKMLPNLDQLRVTKDTDFHSISLDPLTALSWLSSISLLNKAPLLGRPAIPLDDLPPQLRDLDAKHYEIATGSTTGNSSGQLTKLDFLWYTTPDYDVLSLLQCQPRLKVKFSQTLLKQLGFLQADKLWFLGKVLAEQAFNAK